VYSHQVSVIEYTTLAAIGPIPIVISVEPKENPFNGGNPMVAAVLKWLRPSDIISLVASAAA
jgi:hypothetical protein